jgi:hypothetical protein
MNATHCSLKLWFLQHRKKIAEIGTGATLYGIFNWIFNYPLYMWVISDKCLGIVVGGLVMTCLSFIQCAFLLVVFDKMKIDWVGVTYMKDIEKKNDKGRLERVLVWAIKKEHSTFVGNSIKFICFIVMSVLVDPFVVAVHYRKAHFKGVNRHDWQVLTAAVFFANIYWIIRQGILLMIIVTIWNFISQQF